MTIELVILSLLTMAAVLGGAIGYRLGFLAGKKYYERLFR